MTLTARPTVVARADQPLADRGSEWASRLPALLSLTSAPPDLPTPERWLARPLLCGGGLVAVLAGVVLLETSRVALGAAVWLGGVVAVAVAFAGRRPPTPTGTATSRAELAIMGVLFGLALASRIVAPESFPNGVHPDEAAMGLVALGVARGQGPHPFGFAFIGDPVPFMYVEALFLAMFGPTVGSMRLVAGLVGALTVPALWAWIRPMFGRRVALTAAALLAFTASHLHFSRMSLNVIEIGLFGVLGLSFAWRGLTEGRPLWHLLAGFSLGFGQYANFGARAFVLAVGATYAVLLLRRPRAWRVTVIGALVVGLGLLVSLAPQLAHVRDNPSELWDRLQFRSVFRRWDQAVEIHGTAEPLWVMVGQARVNLLAFVSAVDRGPFYGFAQAPLLSPPVSWLFLGGLAIGVARLVDPRYAIIVASCVAVLLGGILSAGAPQFHRLVAMVPIGCALAAIAFDRIVTAFETAVARLGWPSILRPGQATAVLVGGLVALCSAQGIYRVFVLHPTLFPWQPDTAIARWAAAQDGARPVLLAAGPDLSAVDERVRFMADGSDVRDVPNPSIDVPEALAAGTGFVVALSPKLDDWLPLLSFLLPGAGPVNVAGPRGDVLLLRYDAPPGLPAPDQRYGLRGELVGDDRPSGSRRWVDASVAFRESGRISGGRSFRARWYGTVSSDTAGDYRFEAYTDGGVELLLDGRSVFEARPGPDARSIRADVRLAAGEHDIELRYSYVRGPGTLELRWRPPGGERSVIPPERLRPG